ncbi:MAG: hypothetical protein L0154_25570 [Chloroflexi bacterium]|nr:hypothetical protein [Chloroflexota bacterium]
MRIPSGPTVQYGDIAMLIGKDRKVFIRTILEGQKLQTHLGEIRFDEIVGLDYGEQVQTNIGNGLYILPPSLDDLITHIRPDDAIIGHTGFLIFARAVNRIEEDVRQQYRAEQAAAHQNDLNESISAN